ncbi:MAG TPA: Ig-like domain-containing protein [Solimonas sp.]|nr:Ig-like domain-containing protein [Solimonas sp.]
MMAGALALTACGGGSFDTSNGTVAPPGTSASRLTVLASSTVLPANVDDPDDEGAVVINAVARDSNNNALEGVPVTFSANNNGSLVVTRATTDENGRATAILDTGGDPTLRQIQVTATGGGQTGSTTIQVVNPTTGAAPASLVVLLDTPQLSSDADTPAEGVTITAVVKDSGNNVVPGVAVSFSTPDSGEIVVKNGLTDINGRATATVNTGGDPTNRPIRVSVTSGTLTQTTTINVIGTTISLSGPTSTQIGSPTEYTVQLTDAAGDGIPNRVVTFSTNNGAAALSDTSVVTDAGGLATVTLTPNRANTTLTASASGQSVTQPIAVSTDVFAFTDPSGDNLEVRINTNKTITVNWTRAGAPVVGQVVSFASTRGTLSAPSAVTDAAGNATVTINSTASGFATIVATGSGANPPTATRELEFVAVTPAVIELQARPATIGTNQSSDIVAVVRDANNNLVKGKTVEFSLDDSTAGTLSQPIAVTNSQGVATVRYTATSQSSPALSVTVTARVRGTAVQDSTSLTVGASAVDISLGTGAEIQTLGFSRYADPWAVLVADPAGNPVPEAEFRLQLQSVGYFKGTFSNPFFCPNEDLNQNDILDPGEDVNLNGSLEPGRPATVPSTIALEPDTGTAEFNVVYPKSFGAFVLVDLFGIATVSGTETVETRRFVLRVAEDDVDNLPGVSPFGTVLDCSDPN